MTTPQRRRDLTVIDIELVNRMLKKGMLSKVPDSCLGICAATDDWRERHNEKPKVVFVIKSSYETGVK